MSATPTAAPAHPHPAREPPDDGADGVYPRPPARRGPSTWLRLVRLEALREARGRESIQAGLLLGGLLILLHMLVLGSGAASLREGALVLWVPLALATTALAARAWARDADVGALALLRSLPASGAAVAGARLVVQAVLVACVLAVSAAGARYVFGVPLPPQLLALLALGAFGLLLVASLCGAMAAQARAREAMLPTLVIPLASPLLVTAGNGTMEALAGESARDALLLAAGYDLALAAASLLLWPILLEAE
ncbi:MAG TPA: heme exporter protein CcmB [Candidatus Thermoplasmatota archaeon]|nr:heme exporter protein CcmB [Candidatus Thermoplasmatota archaeon]